MSHVIPIWFVPSFYGDIRLKTSEKGVVLICEKLTPAEEKALEKLAKTARKKKWVPGDRETFPAGEYELAGAPIDEVSKLIAKAIKPSRQLVSAVTFADGKISELFDGNSAPYMAPPKAATTVAAPTRGCPTPAFDKAELRAREVLMSFLGPDQQADFRAKNRFVSEGASGRRYMVTSRYAKDSLAQYTRSLYDLDDKMPLCVHDWSVPAAEEMLSLHILLQLPGWESYLRRLESDDAPHDPELEMDDAFALDPDLADFTPPHATLAICKKPDVWG